MSGSNNETYQFTSNLFRPTELIVQSNKIGAVTVKNLYKVTVFDTNNLLILFYKDYDLFLTRKFYKSEAYSDFTIKTLESPEVTTDKQYYSHIREGTTLVGTLLPNGKVLDRVGRVWADSTLWRPTTPL